uniref:Adiponectin receptor protein putative n=1 Tax=Albugo laibachii Nc14 TaxID=890382 RepID=F0W873_9STRA|nr:adiponectin receptor protein putative [Albugo laibachii Nc14]|eukprot:CCA17357.1 adiponectin receptor protein putative [Albugo laibachii Nc14]
MKTRVATLHSFDVLHEEGFAYLADNSYIRSGYRLNYTVRDCVLSLFQLHNETLNVWTHMIGSLIFLGLIVYLIMYENHKPAGANSMSFDSLSDTREEWFTNQKCYSPEMPEGYFIINGKHTKRMMIAGCSPMYSSSVKHFFDTTNSKFSNVYEMSSLWFDHCLHQIPSLERLYNLMEENAEEVSQSIASNIEVLREELTLAKERIREAAMLNCSSVYTQALAGKLRTRVEAFSALLQNAAHNVGADIPVKYVFHELNDLVDTLRNGIAILSSNDDKHQVPHWPIFVFMISAVICLSCSATFHLLFVHSKSVYFFLSRLDYAGITIMIAGSFYPLVYYSFYCHPWIRHMYLTAITVMAAATFVISLIPAFGTPKYLYLRTGVFLGLGTFGIFPISHLIFHFGLSDPHITVTIGPLLLMGALYVSGAVIYATRFPERFYPGRFDVWFSSHQLWHICVVAAALVHFLNSIQQLQWRRDTPCQF